MVNKNKYVIDRDVEIDYQYYNNLANQFKSNYAVNTTNRLDVSLQIREKNKEKNTYEIDNKNNVLLSIPLSQQEISISLDNTNTDKSNQIEQEQRFIVKDISFIIISIIILLLIIITMISLIKKILLLTRKKLTPYQKHIRKILLGFDRIIINVKTIPDKKDYNVIEVETFQELVDVRDNTKEPINYHVIEEHKSCEFFVINDQNLYLYEVKSSDFDKDENNG